VADADALGRRPVVGYFLSGALAIGCAAVVSTLFKSLRDASLWRAVIDMRQSYPWLLMAFVVAVSLAVLADNWGGRADQEPRWARAIEGLVEAALLAVTFLVVREMLAGIPDLTHPIPQISRIAIIAVVGLFLGAFVPGWYRQTRSPARTPALQDAPSSGEQPAVAA
jgi:hypothetical protein